jgi:dolichol-phosphate mannosyltransferase
MRILIIIPTYNERENIVPLINQLLGMQERFDVLVVDDNSPDGTADSVKQNFGSNSRVSLMERPRKLGLGTAHKAGFHFGLDHQYDRIMTMDADFSHDPRHIPSFVAETEHHDMVIGSRYIPGGGTVNWGIFRKLISRTANLFAHVILSLKPRDCTSAFRMYRAQALREINFDSIKAEGYSYNIEFLYRARERGMNVGETPIIFADRTMGKSKISRREIFKAISTILRLKFSRSLNTEQKAVRV